MKLSNLIFFCSFMMVLFVTCIKSTNNNNPNLKEQVEIIKIDTLVNDSSVCLKTELSLNKKKFVLINHFNRSNNFDIKEAFNINNYSGLSVTYQHITINNFIGFSKTMCRDCSFDFFSVFNGDSIDNPEGFNYLYFSKGRIEYIVLRGYFFGCNGTFCNNGVLLIMNFKDNILQKAYLLGVDKSIYNLASLSGQITNKTFYLKFSNISKSTYLQLSFADEIKFVTDTPSLLTNLGFFCIKK